MQNFVSRVKEQTLNALLFCSACAVFVSVAYAAISWPASAPSGETAGGKFAAVINSVLSSGDWKNPGTGKVKSAESADALTTGAEAISIYLNACSGGACS